MDKKNNNNDKLKTRKKESFFQKLKKNKIILATILFSIITLVLQNFNSHISKNVQRYSLFISTFTIALLVIIRFLNFAIKLIPNYTQKLKNKKSNLNKSNKEIEIKNTIAKDLEILFNLITISTNNIVTILLFFNILHHHYPENKSILLIYTLSSKHSFRLCNTLIGIIFNCVGMIFLTYKIIEIQNEKYEDEQKQNIDIALKAIPLALIGIKTLINIVMFCAEIKNSASMTPILEILDIILSLSLAIFRLSEFAYKLAKQSNQANDEDQNKISSTIDVDKNISTQSEGNIIFTEM